MQRTCHARDRARAALRLGRRACEHAELSTRGLLGGEFLLDQPLDARDQGWEPCFSTRSERRVCARRGVELSGRICWCDGRRLRLESYRGFVQLAHRRRKRTHPRAARRHARGVANARHVAFVDLVVCGDLRSRLVGVHIVVQHAGREFGRIVGHGVLCGRRNLVARPRREPPRAKARGAMATRLREADSRW